ncbi:MAG: hypothetical protein DRO23_08055 [Thermoprotei archaeon]|nr:MAG: hypothetical protein DRO23_08055 [Thermoprotei archaeon]
MFRGLKIMVILKDLGEKEVLNRIKDLIMSSRYLPYPDDAIAIRVNEKFFIINIDGFSFKNARYYWMDYYDVGWKAASASISDVIAKGGKPAITLSSLGVRRNMNVRGLRKIIRGLRDSSKHHSALYLGGDLNETPRDEWIDVVTIAISEIHPIPRKSRKPLREGDLVLTWGYYGLTGAALHAHYNKIDIAPWKKVLEKTKRPKVSLKILDLFENLKEYIRSSEDVSDGLAETLWDLSRVNNIGFRISNIPIEEEAVEYAKTYNLNPLDLALYGGEDYNIVFIVDKNVAGKLRDLKMEYYGLEVLGEVIYAKKVYVETKEERVIVGRGWEYFKNK